MDVQSSNPFTKMSTMERCEVNAIIRAGIANQDTPSQIAEKMSVLIDQFRPTCCLGDALAFEITWLTSLALLLKAYPEYKPFITTS